MKESFDLNPPDEDNLETPTCPTCGEEINGKWEHDEYGNYFNSNDSYYAGTNEHNHCKVDRLVGEMTEHVQEDMVILYRACTAIVNLSKKSQDAITSKLFMLNLERLESEASDLLDEIQAGCDYDPKWTE
jgi:hypothetical protein